jgi:hypothetical protein
MANEAAGLPVQFGASVPDVFADDAVMFDMVNNTVRITFGVVTSTEPAAPSPMGMSVIGRLVLPATSAQRLCLGLYDYLKKQGLDPSDLVSGGNAAN